MKIKCIVKHVSAVFYSNSLKVLHYWAAGALVFHADVTLEKNSETSNGDHIKPDLCR